MEINEKKIVLPRHLGNFFIVGSIPFEIEDPSLEEKVEVAYCLPGGLIRRVPQPSCQPLKNVGRSFFPSLLIHLLLLLCFQLV